MLAPAAHPTALDAGACLVSPSRFSNPDPCPASSSSRWSMSTIGSPDPSSRPATALSQAPSQVLRSRWSVSSFAHSTRPPSALSTLSRTNSTADLRGEQPSSSRWSMSTVATRPAFDRKPSATSLAYLKIADEDEDPERVWASDSDGDDESESEAEEAHESTTLAVLDNYYYVPRRDFSRPPSHNKTDELAEWCRRHTGSSSGSSSPELLLQSERKRRQSNVTGNRDALVVALGLPAPPVLPSPATPTTPKTRRAYATRKPVPVVDFDHDDGATLLSVSTQRKSSASSTSSGSGRSESPPATPTTPAMRLERPLLPKDGSRDDHGAWSPWCAPLPYGLPSTPHTRPPATTRAQLRKCASQPHNVLEPPRPPRPRSTAIKARSPTTPAPQPQPQPQPHPLTPTNPMFIFERRRTTSTSAPAAPPSGRGKLTKVRRVSESVPIIGAAVAALREREREKKERERERREAKFLRSM